MRKVCDLRFEVAQRLRRDALGSGREIEGLQRDPARISLAAQNLKDWHVETRLGVRLGETTLDGRFTVEQVFCLGLCAMSPAVMLDDKPYGRVSALVADSLIDGTRSPA